jgi:hypothetical protein
MRCEPKPTRSRTRGQRTAGHDLALRQKSVTHQPLASVSGQLAGMNAEQRRDFGLDRLRQQRSCAIAQNLAQWIGKTSWLGKR